MTKKLSSRNEINRIVFYSKENMATSHNLVKAEKLLNNFNSEKNLTLNDLLEFYNVKLHFDNDLFLPKWSKSDREKYNQIVEENWSSLKKRFQKINDLNIEEIINELEYQYKSNFWELVNKLSIYKNVSHSTFSDILKNFSSQINYILPQKNIVQKFNKVIRDFLMNYKNSAEVLLSQFEEKKSDRNSPRFYFPKSLSLSDKEEIISTYLDREDSNLNYVRLAQKSKDSNELKLSDKTKYKAKKKLKNKTMK